MILNLSIITLIYNRIIFSSCLKILKLNFQIYTQVLINSSCNQRFLNQMKKNRMYNFGVIYEE